MDMEQVEVNLKDQNTDFDMDDSGSDVSTLYSPARSLRQNSAEVDAKPDDGMELSKQIEQDQIVEELDLNSNDEIMTEYIDSPGNEAETMSPGGSSKSIDEAMDFDANNEDALSYKLFGTPKVLSKILSFLPSKVLVKFRMMNKLWNREATLVLINNRRDIQIRFYYDTKSQSHIVSYPYPSCSSKKPLSALNECLKTSTKFPCSHFFIIPGPNWEDTDIDTDISEFLSLFRETNQIKILDLKLIPYITDTKGKINILSKILQSQIIQKVEELNLFGIPKEWQEDEDSLFPEKQEESPLLSQLKSLSFDRYLPQFSQIITLSPNLENLEGDSSYFAVDTLIQLNKLYLIKTLDFLNEDNDVALEFLEKFVDAQPTLQKLYLFNGFDKEPIRMKKKCTNLLSKLLKSSERSLKEISMHAYPEFWVGLPWPTLENLNHIKVAERRGSQNFQVPSNFLPDTFPNLQSLSLQFGIDDEEQRDFWSSILKISDTAHMEKLKKLSIENFYQESVEPLMQTAQNIESLSLYNIKDVKDLRKFVWSFKKLKELELGVTMGPHIKNTAFPFPEMFFTGFSEEMCRKLQKNRDYFRQMKGQELTRDEPSILDCKDLKILKIRCRSFRNGKFLKWDDSTVTNEFAFNRMENLRLEFF